MSDTTTTATTATAEKVAKIEWRHPNWALFSDATTGGVGRTFPTSSDYPKHLVQGDKAVEAVRLSIATGRTGVLVGPHGISKTASVVSSIPSVAAGLGYDDAICVMLSPANKTPDDLKTAAPVRIKVADATKVADGTPEGVELVLKHLLTSELKPGQPFVLLVDDPWQANQITQQMLMQLLGDWGIGPFDLRNFGLIGVVATNNPSLDETNSIVEDFAQKDRFFTIEMSDIDAALGVQIYLAHRYSHLDLKGVFAARAKLSHEMRHTLSWRCLDHVIDVATAGLPPERALPVVEGKRMYLQATSGGRTIDRTAEILGDICAALGVAYIEEVADEPSKVLRTAIERGWSIREIGDPGIGKTALVKDICAQMGLQLEYLSLPTWDPDSEVLPVPTIDGELAAAITEGMISPEAKVICIDEANRAQDILQMSRYNEMVHDRSLGGVKIPNLKAVVSLENPGEFLGMKMDVRSPNIATADRYHYTMFLDTNAMPAIAWLRANAAAQAAFHTVAGPAVTRNRVARHGGADPLTHPVTLDGFDADMQAAVAAKAAELQPSVEVFLDWWTYDLDNDGRAWMTPRGLERMFRMHVAHGRLEWAKLWLEQGEYAPVPLSALEARLSDRPMTGLRDLSENLSEWVSRLSTASAADVDGVGFADADLVHTAFMNADVSQLKEHIDVVAALVKFLPTSYKGTYFITSDPELQKFWQEAMGRASGRIKRTGAVQ